MLPGARLAAFIELACEIERSIACRARPADLLVNQYFRSRRYAGSKDRKAITAYIYEYLRCRELLVWAQSQLVVQETERLLPLLFLTRYYPDLMELLDGSSQYSPEVLDEVEAELVHKSLDLDWSKAPMEATLNTPIWALHGLLKRFPSSISTEMLAMNMPAFFDIRVNTLKASMNIIYQFKESVQCIEKTNFSSVGVRVKTPLNLGAHDTYKKGQIEVQDEAAQIASALIAPQPGMKIIDLCAGAGGKSLTVSSIMNNSGKIIACDISEHRLAEAKKRAVRGGHSNITTCLLPEDRVQRDDMLAQYKGASDRVFIDSPCTGTGTWRRSPDQRWRFNSDTLAEITEMQRSLLLEGANLVKAGGRLIYMTCSMLPQENEDIVKQFLEGQSCFGWKLLDYRTVWRETDLSDRIPATAALIPETLQLTPAQHETDGFYIAIFQREEG
ncbi:RsmB/NOP family class I SAM-dependent RNA methyltransferase [Kordiimonas pumila]|uniref:RsmB/NOP family class I SAM-dependent RNA methyltransferase n=1 Tax=Kordiimonas pumila TaxID=2161677 RepID=A0ABV7D1X8_9PROT|nr:RsmB/NOP family class I SAM-dependent RNA methyltransferase [Kordiimonas pumila]